MRTRDVRFRTAPEREAFSAATFYSATHGLSSPPEEAYLRALPAARLGILHRVIGNVLREPIDALIGPVVASSSEADLTESSSRLGSVGPDSVTLRSRPEGCERVAALGFPGERAVLVVPLSDVYGFDRFDPVGPPELHTEGGVEPVSHPWDLTALIESEGCVPPDGQIERFEAELAESVANLALAYLAEDVLDEEYGASDPLRTLRGADHPPDPTTFLERFPAIEERATNPSSKIRRGMTVTDSFVYAPEFTDRIDLRFVAVPAGNALQSAARGEPRMTDRLFGTFGGLERAVRRSIPDSADVADHAVIPVHPWQFHHTLDAGMPGAGIRPVEGFTVPAAPLLNLRTVVPYPDADGPDHRPHLKLAIDVQKTSSVRTIPQVEIVDGPRLTDVILEIEALEGFDSLGFLTEPAAVCYRSAEGTGPDSESLAALIRTNPATHAAVDDGAVPISPTSLLAPFPPRGPPLVISLIEAFGAERGLGTRPAAKAFLEAYLGTILPDQLTLLTKYGLGLDMHLQNTCVVFDSDARPTGALFRDFGGIRIIPDRLDTHGIDPDLVEGSPVLTSNAGAYRNIANSTLQTHVGELIRVVVERTELEEAECWSLVARLYETAFDRLRDDGAVETAWIDDDRSVLFGETALHDSRTAMRLEGRPREQSVIEVSNPLATHRRSEEDRP